MGRYENSFLFGRQSGLQYWRHAVQLFAFVAANGKAIGLASTSLIVPYLHVTQAPFSTVHGAYESFEYTMARGLFPLLVLGVIYLTAVTVGKIFCGWACPLGALQDFLSYLPFKKQRLSVEWVAQLKDLKWVVLAGSVFCAVVVGFRRSSDSTDEFPLGAFSDSPFSVLSPAATIFAYIPWMVMWNANVLAYAGLVAWVKMAVLVAVIVPSVYVPRFFCRFLCPLGAMMAPVSQYKVVRIKQNNKLPTEELNRLLADVCPMGVTKSKDDTSDYIDSGDCIHCGKCITESPKYLEQKIF